MDPYDDPEWAPILTGQGVGVADREGVRRAMGHARTLSKRVKLARLKPAREIASTGFCLAHPGVQYLIYQPEAGQSFTVKLSDGSYRYEWIEPATLITEKRGNITASGTPRQFSPPTKRDALLLLERQ
jgi:hypothetical protein